MSLNLKLGRIPTLIRFYAKPFCLLLLPCFLLISVPIASKATNAAPISVAVLLPAPNEYPYWANMLRFMRAVARDLKIELRVQYSTASNYAYKRDGLKLLKIQPAANYFVSSYTLGATTHFLEFTEKSATKMFLFNTDIEKSEIELVGRPREKYQHLIGQIRPNDERGGYDLAMLLKKQAIDQGFLERDKTINVCAVNAGDINSAVDNDRVTGLKRALDESLNNTVMLGTYSTNWSRSTTENVTKKILTKHPNTNVIWSAADMMAHGVLDALSQDDMQPGKDLLIGTFDWSPETLDAVESGQLSATLDGHFVEGGWSLILIYDYHHGIDFANSVGTNIVINLEPVTTENATFFKEKLTDPDWDKIDFTQYSKVHNKSLEHYDFSFTKILNKLP